MSREFFILCSRLIPQYARRRVRYWLLRLLNPGRYLELRTLRQIEGEYSLRGFDRNRCIFIHIPKCAGIAINKSLFQNNGGGHLTLTQYSFAFTPAEFDRYFKFTVVRHPLDRLVSTYFFLKSGGFDTEDAKWSLENLSGIRSFEEFVLEWLTEDRIWSKTHLVPQHWFLEDCWGEIPLDFIGRYEQLSSDFGYIRQVLDRPDVELVRLNQSKHRPYSEYYNKETSRKVAELYSKDMALFGYSI